MTNSRRSGPIALLCKTNPSAEPAHEGISVLLVEHGSVLTISRDLVKLGYVRRAASWPSTAITLPPMRCWVGTNEIQRNVIAAQLVARGGLAP